MKAYNHNEFEFEQYLEEALDLNDRRAQFFAERVIDISRTLQISIEDAEVLAEEHGVYIPEKGRDIAIMILEMGLSLKQATTLYESGFKLEGGCFFNSSPKADPCF